MGRVASPAPVVPSVEQAYPLHAASDIYDPLGLGVGASTSPKSPVMPILIAGVAGFAIVSFVMVIALIIRGRTAIRRRNLRASAIAAATEGAAIAPSSSSGSQRMRPPKPMHVPVPIVVVEPDQSVEIAFRLAQGPDPSGESPQRTTFPPGQLPMLRTPTVTQLAEVAAKTEGKQAGGSPDGGS